MPPCSPGLYFPGLFWPSLFCLATARGAAPAGCSLARQHLQAEITIMVVRGRYIFHRIIVVTHAARESLPN